MIGTIKQEELEGRQLSVYLPPSYGNGDSAYPVVYVQDNNSLVKHCMNLLEHYFVMNRLSEFISVGIEPRNRNDEYTPWPEPSLTSRYPAFGGKGGEYAAFMAERVKPYIDQRYRTRPDTVNTGIMGASFGGLISIYSAYVYPEVFGRIASLSASLWYTGMIDFMRKQPLPSPLHRMYLSVGSLEGIYNNSVQKHMASYTREAGQILLEKGLSQDRLKLVVEAGATHDVVFFAKHVPEALSWLFTDK